MTIEEATKNLEKAKLDLYKAIEEAYPKGTQIHTVVDIEVVAHDKENVIVKLPSGNRQIKHYSFL